MKPTAMYSVAAVLGMVGAFAISERDAFPESAWTGLWEDDATELVLLMRPANCGIDGGEIEALTRFAAESKVPVRAVFVQHVAPQDRERVIELFGFDFPVSYDDTEAWTRATMISGIPSQAALLVRRGQINGVVGLDEWRTLSEMADLR